MNDNSFWPNEWLFTFNKTLNGCVTFPTYLKGCYLLLSIAVKHPTLEHVISCTDMISPTTYLMSHIKMNEGCQWFQILILNQHFHYG